MKRQSRSPLFRLPLGNHCVPLMFMLTAVVLGNAQAQQIDCVTDSDCTAALGQGSICLDHVCTGRYERGCLYQRLGSLRVCNSEDPVDAEAQGLCRMPDIPHPEVRIYAQDWESSLFQSWLLQVILSELLDVPSSIETGRLDINRNFYNSKNVEFSPAATEEIYYNDFTGMLPSFLNADRLGDCRRANKIPAKYETCAHMTPESWIESSDFATTEVLVESGVIEPPRPTGALGRRALYIPRFTAERDPSLLSFLGLQGEENREKLAATFLRPTTWQDYCEQISPTNCTVPDSVAARAPRASLLETERFFVPSLYTGHFRKTWKNQCNETKCTGHVADFPCGMMSPLYAQLYHLNIALEGDGPYLHSQSYNRWQQKEIWRAANATKSNVAMYWWSPESTYEEFLGTEAEFTKVSFPVPTQECMDYRSSNRCSPSLSSRVGDSRAVCEDPPTQLSMITTRMLRNQTFGVPRAIQSPAYEAMKLFTLSDLRLAEMLDYIRNEKTPRQAVCEWIDDNFDLIKSRFVPPTYPRTVREKQHTGFMSVALALGAVATLLIVLAGRETHKQRLKPIVRNAQVDFLFLVLGGSLLIAIGSIIVAIPPSNPSCVAQLWLIHLGYTLSLVPQIVKVGAINRLMTAARRFQRMTLDLRSLYGAVVLLSTLVVGFLAIWSSLDPPQRVVEYELTDDVFDGKGVVSVGYTCASSSNIWELIAISWNFVLLLCAVVLAFQTRNLENSFNESKSLGNLIYANFVFLIFRAVTFIAASNLSSPVLPLVRSIIFSLDAVATIVIYFLPKFFADDSNPTRDPSWPRSLSRGESSDDLPNSVHGVRRGGLRRGQSFVSRSRRVEHPPTNPFLRFVTGISNITMQGAGDESDHVIEETKAESKDDEEDPRAQDLAEKVSSSPESESSGTFACDTASECEKDKDKSLIAQHEEIIRLLREENESLRRRLATTKHSQSDDSTKTALW